jgi:hypothetical protein
MASKVGLWGEAESGVSEKAFLKRDIVNLRKIADLMV